MALRPEMQICLLVDSTTSKGYIHTQEEKVTKMKSVALQKKLDDLWSTQDLMVRFRVTAMTIHLWRENRALPALVIPGAKRPTVRFVPTEVENWAKSNKVQMFPV
jgi:hypothetical protein